MEGRMNKLLALIPTWETFLLYIGGIPSLVSGTLLAIMIFFTARNKAFSLSEYKHLRQQNKQILKKEQALRNNINSAPRGVQFIYRRIIGETNYHDLINGG